MDSTMVDSKIVVIRGSTDILNSAYSSTFADGKREFPSIDHYCQYQILLKIGYPSEANQIFEIPTPRGREKFVRQFVVGDYFRGDIVRGNRFITDVRDEFLRIGLRLRFDQDPSFRRALMDTGRALLAHCDPDDFQYGLGMDERQFSNWIDASGVQTDVLFGWFRRYDSCPCPDVIGNNKLGVALMEIRTDEFERSSTTATTATRRDGLQQTSANPLATAASSIVPSAIGQQSIMAKPTAAIQLSESEIDEFLHQRYAIPFDDDDGDRENDEVVAGPEWIVSDQILALDGPFAVLSQYYPTPFSTRKRKYRSVEHYAYQKLFRKLKLGRKAKEKLITSPDPSKLSGLARRLISEFWKDGNKEKSESNGEENPDANDNMNYEDLLEFYERGTKLKFDQHPVLKRLLMATGDALLIETCPTSDWRATNEWSIGVRESDVQRFLTTSPYSASDLLRFVTRSDATRKLVSRYFSGGGGSIGRNRGGLTLMRLRREFKSANVEILHLPPPPPTGGELDENRLICFTGASVFHPSYVAPFWTKEGELFATVQHFLCVEAAKKFGFSEKVQKELADCDANDANGLLTWFVYQRFPDPDRYLDWTWSGGRDESFKTACRLKLEKHPELLRGLLETGNSLLIYCRGRFESDDTEWSIGMAESDLRSWIQETRCDCRTLLKWCLSPLERRPAFLGGNRLGALLMELRREFRLRGFQPHTLPKVGVPMGVVLGTGSESDVDDEDDEIVEEDKTDVVWPTPHFLLSRKRGQPILDRPNKKRKLNDQSSGLPTGGIGGGGAQQQVNMVANMGTDQLKQTAAVFVSKLLAMRKETESENESLRQLLTDLAELRDRIPEIEVAPPVESEPVQSELATTAVAEPAVASSKPAVAEPVQPPTQPAPAIPDEKERWRAFETGMLDILRHSATVKKPKDQKSNGAQTEDEDGDASLFNPKNWNEQWVRPLVSRVWPHLTIRERQTASEWLWYTINKLENMRRHRAAEMQRREASTMATAAVGVDTGLGSLVPTGKSKNKWIMSQVNVLMTQKTSGGDEARAATPQGEGTTIDAVKYAVDWKQPEAGVFPKVLGPASP